MAGNYEERLKKLSGDAELAEAKRLLKGGGAPVCAWRDADQKIHAAFQLRNDYAKVDAKVDGKSEPHFECSCGREGDHGCSHAVAALMYCSRFRNELGPIDEGETKFAGLKYEDISTLASQEPAQCSATLSIHALSAFPHVPSKWENAVLNIKLQTESREYLGNLNNIRQLYFENSLTVYLKLSQFSLHDQQIIRFLAINGKPENSNILLNSEETAEFFFCLVGFERFFREGRRLVIHGETAAAVVLAKKEGAVQKFTPAILVGRRALGMPNAKIITGRAGCWVGKSGEYFFIPASADLGWLRNFFRAGVQSVPNNSPENLFKNGHFPLPIVSAETLDLELRKPTAFLSGALDANQVLNLKLEYVYNDRCFPNDAARLGRMPNRFFRRDEQAETLLGNELKLFGFKGEPSEVLTIADPEAIGIFLDKVLPMWMRRGNLALSGELSLLCRGGAGLEPCTFRCKAISPVNDGYLVGYSSNSPVPFNQLYRAARETRNYLYCGGSILKIGESLQKFLLAAESVMTNINEKEQTFELPFHAYHYWHNISATVPEAMPPELLNLISAVEAPLAIAPDFHFEGTLRSYQTEGVAWLRQMTDRNFNVVLADEMGLGKTVQLLALLAERKTRKHHPALIICPSSLVVNWEREAHRFIPDFRVATLDGAGRAELWKNAEEYDLLISSYACIRRDKELFAQNDFSYLVLDEAQHIKNPGTANAQSCKAISALHRIVLTGTPLENSPEDLWSLFDFLHPGMLGSFNAFRKEYAGIAESKFLQEDLVMRVSPFIKRRTKANVALELPPKQEFTTFCEMEPAQRRLYNATLAERRKQLEQLSPENPHCNTEIFTTLLRLRQICCDPRLLPDNHGARCPSAKMELLHELVLGHIDSGHKILLFSQFTSLLALMCEWLDQDGIAYEYLDGATRNRQSHVDNFNNNKDINLFLLSLKAGGTGLNLTSADTVIIYDPWWNPAVELQAADRTHRIGQTRQVSSIKLLVKDSVEEKILNLQKKKQELFDNVIDNPNAACEKLSIDDLKYLLN
ncbi:MAG: DEAD/DEAH box helicase [Victivallaceae bacterium]|nr:DEAD/DEAH box helicase [Victivallaceae bacterium]